VNWRGSKRNYSQTWTNQTSRQPLTSPGTVTYVASIILFVGRRTKTTGAARVMVTVAQAIY